MSDQLQPQDTLDDRGVDDILDGPVGGEVGDQRTGRLAAREDDTSSYAEDEGIDGAGASAEEAAIHTIED